jgi:rapamycin-insensitive companion of mTOR
MNVQSDPSAQDIILDMFFDLLNIKTPIWYQPFIDGRRLTGRLISTIKNTHTHSVVPVYQKSNGSAGPEPDDLHDHPSHSLKLTDQYIGLLILVFTHAGLLDVRQWRRALSMYAHCP